MEEAKNILHKVGINWDGNSLSFRPNFFSNEIYIEINSINTVFIEKANVSIIRNLAFWFNRIVFFNI